jgi:hypothetical protein
MPYQKEQLKYSAVSAVIGSLLWLLLDQIYTALNFSFYFVPDALATSLSVFLGVFLVLSIIAKIEKPSFSLTLPVFLIYLGVLLPIIFITKVVPALTVTVPPFLTPYELFLDWLRYGVPYIATFSLIGIIAGIMMVRLASKLKYDAFYFIFSTIIGAGAGTFLIKICWEVRYAVAYLPLFALIGTLMGIIIIQIAWLRKRKTSNIHTCISVALWIIAFITAIFLYEWATYVQPPWF